MTDIPRTGKLTKEEIFEAADAIRDRGENVTQEAVRHECKDRGSYSTINKHLKTWQEESEAITSRISREVTPELERQGLDLIAKISELMSQRANERCAQLDAGYKAEIALKNAALDEACAEADQYHMSLAEAKTRNTELMHDIYASEAVNERHVDDSMALRKNIQSLEANRENHLLRIQQDQQKIGSLEAKIDQALTNAGQFEGIASRLKEQLSEQNKQLAEFGRIIGGYEESLIRADEDCKRMAAQIDHLSKKYAGLELANSMLLDASLICLPKPMNQDCNIAA